VKSGRKPIFFVLCNKEPVPAGASWTRLIQPLFTGSSSMMMKKRLSAVVSTSVAYAIVSSAFALAELQEAATTKSTPPPAQAAPGAKSPEVKSPKVRVYKSAPSPKVAAAAVEKRNAALKKAGAVREQARAVRRVVAMNLDGQAQQMMMQFRPILRAEFHVIRVACQPTPEQRKAIAQAAEQTLRDTTKKYVESMRRPMTMAQRAANEPRKLIEEGLVAALKSKVSAEQAARYQAELTKRTAARKRLTLRNLVARLDRELILSHKQRDQISESLSSHWDDSWGHSIEMFMNDNNYSPPIPDHVVAPFLNEPQVKIWRSIPKYQGFFGGFGIMGGIMMNNDPLEDEELREARLAAEAKEPEQAPMMNMVPMKAQMKMRVIQKVDQRKK
jgi:hypothetical protein